MDAVAVSHGERFFLLRLELRPMANTISQSAHIPLLGISILFSLLFSFFLSRHGSYYNTLIRAMQRLDSRR